jgi:c-di-GMP-binding flagellar brake protein YcgR
MAETPNDDSIADKPDPARVSPLVEPRNFAKFLLYGKKDILAVLNKLREDVSLITMFFDSGRELLLTSLIAADEESLVLDFGPDSSVNRKALAADKLFCVASQGKVRIQFELGRLTQISVDDRPAFRAALPASVLRLQRRDFFRLAMPVTRPLKCTMPVADPDGNVQSVTTNVVDLSGGGLAMTVPKGMTFERDMEFADCNIELPEIGNITMTIAVRNVFEVELRSGAHITRAGCEFVKPSGLSLTLIQRYIMKVERERKARESGLL